jgi:hypothetical protein
VLLRYLAVAHFGRGQGDYRDLEQPSHWSASVEESLRGRQSRLQALWEAAGRDGDPGDGAAPRELTAIVEETVREVLGHAYPHARELLTSA